MTTENEKQPVNISRCVNTELHTSCAELSVFFHTVLVYGNGIILREP